MTERLLLMFSRCGLLPIFASGQTLEAEILEFPLQFRDDLQASGISSDDPSLGCFVWEGTPRLIQLQNNQLDCDLTEGTYRQPTDQEWQALRDGRNPWPSVLPAR